MGSEALFAIGVVGAIVPLAATAARAFRAADRRAAALGLSGSDVLHRSRGEELMAAARAAPMPESAAIWSSSSDDLPASGDAVDDGSLNAPRVRHEPRVAGYRRRR